MNYRPKQRRKKVKKKLKTVLKVESEKNGKIFFF